MGNLMLGQWSGTAGDLWGRPIVGKSTTLGFPVFVVAAGPVYQDGQASTVAAAAVVLTGTVIRHGVTAAVDELLGTYTPSLVAQGASSIEVEGIARPVGRVSAHGAALFEQAASVDASGNACAAGIAESETILEAPARGAAIRQGLVGTASEALANLGRASAIRPGAVVAIDEAGVKASAIVCAAGAARAIDELVLVVDGSTIGSGTSESQTDTLTAITGAVVSFGAAEHQSSALVVSTGGAMRASGATRTAAQVELRLAPTLITVGDAGAVTECLTDVVSGVLANGIVATAADSLMLPNGRVIRIARLCLDQETMSALTGRALLSGATCPRTDTLLSVQGSMSANTMGVSSDEAVVQAAGGLIRSSGLVLIETIEDLTPVGSVFGTSIRGQLRPTPTINGRFTGSTRLTGRLAPRLTIVGVIRHGYYSDD